MKTISDMELCEIIKSVCPYEHGCAWCRLYNDYETALEKSRKLVERMEGMTEHEAIEWIKKIYIDTNQSDRCISLKMAISALMEIQQYRAIGTVEEVQELKEISFSGIESAGIAARMMRLKKYEAIGTVEECQEAMEKQKLKNPDVWGDGYSEGEMVYDMYDCPGCGESYEIDGGKYDFCPNCGQALNWNT